MKYDIPLLEELNEEFKRCYILLTERLVMKEAI